MNHNAILFPKRMIINTDKSSKPGEHCGALVLTGKEQLFVVLFIIRNYCVKLDMYLI